MSRLAAADCLAARIDHKIHGCGVLHFATVLVEYARLQTEIIIVGNCQRLLVDQRKSLRFFGDPADRVKVEQFGFQQWTDIGPVGTIDRFEIICKESKDREGDIEHYLDVEMRIDNLLRDKGFLNRDVKVVPHKGSAKNFHDRQIDVVTVRADGCDELHRFFLTGGIDYLMDDSAATKVFHILIMS